MKYMILKKYYSYVTPFMVTALVYFLFVATAHAQPLLPGISCGLTSSGANRCCLSDRDFGEIEDPGVWERFTGAVGFDTAEKAARAKRIISGTVKKIQSKNAYNDLCLAGGTPDFDLDDDQKIKSCTCILEPADGANNLIAEQMCSRYLSSTEETPEREECITCASNRGYWSGLGCIPMSLDKFVSQVILNVGIGLGGLIAFLCILINSIRLQLLRNDSTKLQQIRENLTSCILGLVLILFSVVILRFADIAILGGLIGG